MIMKGQFLERMTVVQSGELQLEGLFHEGTARIPALVASPHPVFGGSMDSPVCAELAWALSRKGLATLRFNYRGVGASQGRGHETRPDAHDELMDLRAAARLLAATAKAERVHVAGYSFGAWLSSWMALEDGSAVDRLVLVAPPIREMPFDFAALSRRKIPTMVIVGSDDHHFDFERLGELASLDGFTVERIPEADHGFRKGLATAGKLAAEHLLQDEHGALIELPEADGDLELDVDGR